MKFIVSIVYYDSALDIFKETLKSIARALDHTSINIDDLSAKVVVVDNGAILSKLRELVSGTIGVKNYDWMVLGTGGNIGYGAAHNLVILNEQSDYHLVINPDVEVLEDAFTKAINYMQQHHEVGLLSPYSQNPEGYKQYLWKRYPTVLDLFLRGFAPKFIKRFFAIRMQEYEMRWDLEDQALSQKVMASGCFMFVRYSILNKVKGFSPDFFVYFEDFDLSIRIARRANIAYVPDVKIVHGGGNASKKGLKHIIMFARSAFVFYRKHGWRWV
jgi:GT2 family glycosyltransferase